MTPADMSVTEQWERLADWSLTLTEPLLSLSKRARLEDDLASIQVREPDMVALFLGGVCSDMIRTLPDEDPWRHVSARYGTQVAGDNPPDDPAVVTATGAPFGTWLDATDASPLVYSEPEHDPALVALAGDDLTLAAGAVLAAAGTHWRNAARMVAEVRAVELANPDPNLVSITDLTTRETFRRGTALHSAREAGIQAVRWAVHRRRAYTGPSDPWINESASRWAWRASRGKFARWDAGDVETAIATEKVRRRPQRVILDDDF